jgi:hypothetical protein
MSKTLVSATAVREYFNADPKRLSKLSDKARKTVEKVDGRFPKGRLSPEAIKYHNKNRKGVEYAPGATARLRDEAKAEAKRLREAAAEAGVAVGGRGPLSKAAREALATPKPDSE